MTDTAPPSDRHTTVHVEADPELPVVRMTRDFRATPEQLYRLHTEADLCARWVGPRGLRTTVEHWDARRGGSWRLRCAGDNPPVELVFYGSFHEVRPGLVVQTLGAEGNPDQVSLETITFTDLGGGWTRLRATSQVGSLRTRDQMMIAGAETGMDEGYQAMDRLLAEGLV